MTPCEKYVCDYSADFMEQNWDKIMYERWDIKKTEKKKFIKEVLKNPQDAIWVITEIMDWGMDKNYYKELLVFPKPNEETTENFKVLKLGDKYIKYIWTSEYIYIMSFTEPKTKTITATYFE